MQNMSSLALFVCVLYSVDMQEVTISQLRKPDRRSTSGKSFAVYFCLLQSVWKLEGPCQ